MQWTDRLGYRLKLRDLHILLAVAESGSMSKAAERLAVSAPVVSKAIADIEHTFGVRMLDRTPRGVEPTLYGHALLDSGIAAFDALKQGARQIEFLSNPTVGEVRIGCSEPFAAGLLPAIVEQMGRQYPGIVCHVVQTPSAPTLEFRELRERRVDLMVARFDKSIAEDLEAKNSLPRADLCGGGTAQQMGATPAHRPGRDHQRTLGYHAGRHPADSAARTGV